MHNVVRFVSLLYKANRFYVAVRLFSNRSQKKAKCGKNKKGMFLCYLLLNRCTATWNVIVKQATNPKELFHSFYPRVSAGVHPALKKREDSGLEIGYELTSGSLFLPYLGLESSRFSFRYYELIERLPFAFNTFASRVWSRCESV